MFCSTPLQNQISNSKLKSTSHKQISHSKLRNQSSPYYHSKSDNESLSSDTPHPSTPISSDQSSTHSPLFVTPATTTSPSSAHTTYSRCSSRTSLSSFDFKSTHSSIPSSNGFITPGSYSDIPDSPSETFLFKNKTLDSNPSKSNEITIIEKTILAQTYPDYEEEEQVKSYNLEDSICELKSNVSCLTFPNEPKPNFNFLKNILEKNQINFTPPVKLSKDLDEDKDSIRYYNQEEEEEEEEDRQSLASVPSLIRNDFNEQNNKFNSLNNYPALFKKIKEKSPIRRVSLNKEEEDEDDSKILFEFIDECYKNINKKEETLSEEEVEIDFNKCPELDIIKNQQYNNPLKQETISLLPKIEEEETESASLQGKKKAKPIVVKLTRTALLRANKLKQTNSSQNQAKSLIKKSNVQSKLSQSKQKPVLASLNLNQIKK